MEKALKAFLTLHKQVFGKIHDLLRLGKQCTAIDDALAELVEQSVALTKYAWMYRYPAEVPEPAPGEGEANLDWLGS